MSAAVISALTLLQAQPLPEADYLVIDTTEWGPPQPTQLYRDTHRLLTVMHDLDLLRYRPARLNPDEVLSCLTPGERDRVGRPTPAQHACILQAASAAEGPPVVVILTGHTRAAGAWQDMDCIGPAGVGRIEGVYVDGAFAMHADMRRRARDLTLACVNDALTGQTASAAAQ